MNEERGHRNLKLYNTYSKDWNKREEMAKDKLSEAIKKQSKKQDFKTNRVSIMNHGEQVRQKSELKQIISLIKEQNSNGNWASNLRQFSKAKNRLSQPPTKTNMYHEMMGLEPNARHCHVGKRNDKK